MSRTGTAFAGGAALAFALLMTLPLWVKALDYEAYTVRSGSMSPALRSGSVIFVKHITTDDKLHANEIITFRQPGRGSALVTHRIVALPVVDGLEYAETKGDANGATDAWRVTRADIIGRSSFTVPHLGYATTFLHSPPVIIGLLMMLAVSLPRTRSSLRG